LAIEMDPVAHVVESVYGKGHFPLENSQNIPHDVSFL
jgi:hypothetical protein